MYTKDSRNSCKQQILMPQHYQKHRYSRWNIIALLNAGTGDCKLCLRIGDRNGLRVGTETWTEVDSVVSCWLMMSICSCVNS